LFWYQIPAPIGTQLYSKPESGMHVTEMMTCDWSMIIVDVSRVVKLYAVLLFVYLSNTGIQPCLFSAPEIFFPDALE